MSDADESAKLALELLRIFKELPPKDQAAVLELVKVFGTRRRINCRNRSSGYSCRVEAVGGFDGGTNLKLKYGTDRTGRVLA
jgi:hypothetical protein